MYRARKTKTEYYDHQYSHKVKTWLGGKKSTGPKKKKNEGPKIELTL